MTNAVLNVDVSFFSKQSENAEDGVLVTAKKSVKFADGVCPGEGTSPSGGEELSSPPPAKMPKEKRYKKTRELKKAKKRKVKVRRFVIKWLNYSEYEDETYVTGYDSMFHSDTSSALRLREQKQK